MFWTYIAVFVIAALIVVGNYVLMQMAHLMKIKGYWMALIPVVQLYVIGKMIGTIDINGKQLKHPEYILPVAVIGIIVLLFNFYFNLPVNVAVATILLIIFSVIWLYGLQTFFLTFGCSYKKSIWFTLIGGILLIPLPIFIIAIRNNEPQFEEIVVKEKRKKNPNKKKKSGKNKHH